MAAKNSKLVCSVNSGSFSMYNNACKDSCWAVSIMLIDLFQTLQLCIKCLFGFNMLPQTTFFVRRKWLNKIVKFWCWFSLISYKLINGFFFKGSKHMLYTSGNKRNILELEVTFYIRTSHYCSWNVSDIIHCKRWRYFWVMNKHFIVNKPTKSQPTNEKYHWVKFCLSHSKIPQEIDSIETILLVRLESRGRIPWNL